MAIYVIFARAVQMIANVNKRRVHLKMFFYFPKFFHVFFRKP